MTKRDKENIIVGMIMIIVTIAIIVGMFITCKVIERMSQIVEEESKMIVELWMENEIKKEKTRVLEEALENNYIVVWFNN